MALGADAVYIGTAAVMAIISEQAVEAVPFEPPTSLVVYTGKMTDQLDIETGAENLHKFLKACVKEMEMLTFSMGKTALAEIDKSDICSLDPFLAKATGIQLGYISEEEQKDFFSKNYPF